MSRVSLPPFKILVFTFLPALLLCEMLGAQGSPLDFKTAAITKLERAKTGDTAFDEAVDEILADVEAGINRDGRSLFLDEFHLLASPDGDLAFAADHDAVGSIAQLLSDNLRPSRRELLEQVRRDLTTADELLASIALREAVALRADTPPNRSRIDQAQAFLDLGRQQRDLEHFRQAVSAFGKAWTRAAAALPPRVPAADGAPLVSISYPASGCVVASSPVTVSGIVQDLIVQDGVVGSVSGADVDVAVNGVAAEVANRSFLAREVELQEGLNILIATVVDQDGNSATAVSTVILDTTPNDRIVLVSGNNQSAPILTTLPAPLVVELTDAQGAPAVGETAIFRVLRGDGSLTGGVRAVAVETDAAGLARTSLTLGARAGVGTDLVRATAVGFSGEVFFTSIATSGAPQSVFVANGDNQRGGVGESLLKPLVAVVYDAGDNPVAGVDVTFTVREGSSTLDDGTPSGAANVTVVTDGNGFAWANLRLGVTEGLDNHLVDATFAGSTAFPATFKASALVLGDPAATAVAGVVLDNQEQPVPRVTIHLEDTSLTAVTDMAGQFKITDVPPGSHELVADGGTTSRPGLWPSVSFVVEALPGRTNTLGRPIYLLPLDVANGKTANPETDVVVTVPNAPGLELTIPAGSATFGDGSKTGLVTMTAVDADNVPMEPPMGMQPRFIVTIHPPDVHFDPPAPLTLPNGDGLAPGTVRELFSFDHDLESFVPIGTGAVSEDGRVIRSDPGFGVVKGGWHCGAINPATGDADFLRISFDPINVPAGVNTVTLTVSGEPAMDSCYFWELIPPMGNPPIGTLDPAAAGSVPITPGEMAALVADCNTNLPGPGPFWDLDQSQSSATLTNLSITPGADTFKVKVTIICHTTCEVETVTTLVVFQP